MSQCEDVELKDLVTEALEKNGVLAKLRAQIRAQIFMTLEDENGQKHQNPKLKSVLESQYGFHALILIQELLEFCNLVQTSSVFKSETGQGKWYVYEGRDVSVSKYFKFANQNNGDTCDIPVLVHLIQLLFELSKIRGVNHEENVSNLEEKSFESDGGINVDTQNNTFVVNSGRSDNYDLSFVSDADSSGSSVEKKKTSLNLTNSTASSDSISTELNDYKSRSPEYGKFVNSNSESEHSTKQDGDTHDSSRMISEVLINNETSQGDSTSSEVVKSETTKESVKLVSKSNKEENSESNKTSKSTSSNNNSSSGSYSKYLKEKQNNSKMASENQQPKQLNVNQDGEPVDIVMKHVVQSRINERQESEELQAFEKSSSIEESNGLPETSISLDISQDDSVKSNDTLSPVRNILDETLPESPKTKQKVIDNINNLKMQSLHITDDDQIIFSDVDIKNNLKNSNRLKKNNKNIDADVSKFNENNKTVIKLVNNEKKNNIKNDLLIADNTNILTLYKNNSTSSNSKTSVIVSPDTNS